jgi:hypothetical protein
MPRKASPVDVRVNRRLSKSESGLSYVRRNRCSFKPWRLIHCADRRMPSAVKVHTLLTGCLYPHLPSNLLPLNRFSRWMVIPWGSVVNVNCFGNMYSFCFAVLRTLSKSKSTRKSTSSAKRDVCCVSVVIDIYSWFWSSTFYSLLLHRLNDLHRPNNQPTGRLSKLRCAVQNVFRPRYSLRLCRDIPHVMDPNDTECYTKLIMPEHGGVAVDSSIPVMILCDCWTESISVIVQGSTPREVPD